MGRKTRQKLALYPEFFSEAARSRGQDASLIGKIGNLLFFSHEMLVIIHSILETKKDVSKEKYNKVPFVYIRSFLSL